MTTLAAAIDAITGRIDAEWAGRTPVAYQNRNYTPVVGTDYIAVDIFHTSGETATIGVQDAHYRVLGEIVIDVFVPPNTATSAAADHVVLLLAMFRGVTVSGTSLRFFDVTPSEIGIDEAGWFQFRVTIQFTYFDT